MNYEIDPGLDKKLRKIKVSDRNLSAKIQKQLVLFEENHKHPSLRLHRLSGNLDNIYSISIDRSVRMLLIFEKNTAIFFDIGTHDEVYKK